MTTVMIASGKTETSATDPAYLAAKAAGQRAGDASMKAAGRKRWNHSDYLAAAKARDALLGDA